MLLNLPASLVRFARFAILAGLLALAGCQPAVAPAAVAPAVAQAAAPVTHAGLAIGQAFPPFMLDFLARGGARPLMNGKLVVLNIWASWCPPCRREMPGLQQLAGKLDPQRFAVIGLSTDQDANAASEMLLRLDIRFANFLDPGGDMTRRLGTDSYPETFIIGADGVLLARMSGYQDWDQPAVLAKIEALYAAQPAARAPGRSGGS